MYVHHGLMCVLRNQTRKGVRVPGTGVTSGHEPPSVGAGNQTPELCKSSK